MIQVVTTAEQHLQDKKYSEALELLLNVNRQNLGEWESAYVATLIVEANLFLGNRVDSGYLDTAIETFRYTEAAWFARAKYLKAWGLASEGQFVEAGELLLESYASYLRCNDLYRAGKALNRLAFVTIHTGKIETSIANSLKSCGIYKKLEMSGVASIVTMNLAFFFFLAGRISDSLTKYAEIKDEIVKQGNKNTLVYYEMSAIPHALRGDYKTARKTIAKCAPFLDEFARERAIYFENVGWINNLDGCYEDALEALNQGFEISMEIAPESALVSQIKRLMADAYIGLEQYDKAQKAADQAMVVARKINERLEIAAVYRAYAQIETHNGNDDIARQHYVEAIDLLNLIGARYELAVTRLLAASGSLFDNGEKTALLYMSREYFESEDLSHLLAQADKLIASGSRCSARPKLSANDAPVIITQNKAMKKLLKLAENVAGSEMTVFLTGPTGSGKDLLAKYIHYHSGRTGAFVTFNSAAVPNTMVEAELFGYKKGAFTGADDRQGLIETADRGTFYLNEIGDSTLEFQAKLLEVLETRKVRRLGENDYRPVNFRLIAATNHDLQKRMHEGLFRPDLYHRLNEIPISLPSLSERTEDIAPLVSYFLAPHGLGKNGDGESRDKLVQILNDQCWPGNIRQLQAEINRLAVACDGSLDRMIDSAERDSDRSELDELKAALKDSEWNQRETARILGVSESTVRYRMKKHGCPTIYGG